MSEADGLKRLTEYLNQTRKQAEVAVDCLNLRIRELEHEREKYLGERDYYKNYAEQLRVENSKKWRLQERDDWKALVDSVQKDRSRLQDECHLLEEELSLAHEELNRLEEARALTQHDVDSNIEIGGEIQEEIHLENHQDIHNEDYHHNHHEDMLEYETETECTTPIPDEQSPSKQYQDTEADSNTSARSSTPTDMLANTLPSLSVTLPGSNEKEKLPDPSGISRTSSTSSSRTGSPRAFQKIASNKSTPRHSSTATSPTPSRRLSLTGGDRDREPTTPSPSPSPVPNDGSPRAVVRELRKELAKAHAEIDILRKTSTTESLAQEQEIARLREEVHMLRLREQEISGKTSVGVVATDHSQDSSIFSHGESSYPPAIPQPPSHIDASPSSSISMWSPLSVLGYFFSYSSTTSSSKTHSAEPRTSAQYV